MTDYTAAFSLAAAGTMSVSLPPTSVSHPLSEKFSGIVLNQNIFPEHPDDCVTLGYNWVYQEFFLPTDLPRGTVDQKTPPLTGLQFFATVEAGKRHAVGFDYRVEYYLDGYGWVGATMGTTVGAPDESATEDPYNGIWLSTYFEPLDITETWRLRWRFGIRGRAPASSVLDLPVDYDGKNITIGPDLVPVSDVSNGPLQEGQYYPFEHNGDPAVVFVEPGSEQVFYSTQQGLHCIWYSVPDPLVGVRAYGPDGVNRLTDDTRDLSFRFRILSGIADEGDDFLGSSYRSLVVTNSVDNVSTEEDATENKFWLSQPNPSRFAVESLYFDVRNAGDAVVIDRVFLNPITPGVSVNVYYSNDDQPGVDPDSWANLLWSRVPINITMTKSESHVLPDPIAAKYVMLEFTQLQARYYAPGNFQSPTIYNRYPKWVSDYYFALYEGSFRPDQFASDQVTLEYNALDLAYNYYLGDLLQAPDAPQPIDPQAAASSLATFFGTTPTDLEDVDTETLSRIRQVFQPFLQAPSETGTFDSLLGQYGSPITAVTQDYSTEEITFAVRYDADASDADQNAILVEKNYPVMSFFVTCRHRYLKAQAYFSRDRAYFAGVAEVAFTRDHYSTEFDHDLYIESAGDTINVERNDFETVNFTWVTHTNA